MDEYEIIIEYNKTAFRMLRDMVISDRKGSQQTRRAISDEVSSSFPRLTKDQLRYYSEGMRGFRVVFVSDAPKSGESDSNPSGVPAFYDPYTDRWVRFSDYRPINASHISASNTPGKIINITIEVGDTSATITWVEPMYMGASISSYDLEYREGNNREFTRVTEITDTMYMFSELSNNQVYQISIRAVNSDSIPGLWSNILNFTPISDPTVPHTPSRPRINALEGGLEVTWDEPNNGGAVILNYNLRYNIQGSTIFVEVTGITGLSRILPGLIPESTYEVSVQASNTIGLSLYSEPGIGIPEGIAPGRFQELQWDGENIQWDTQSGSGTMYETLSWPS